MSEFQYTTVPGKLSELFSKLREVGVPQKATAQWLKSIGFKSSNDASLLPLLKLIRFADDGGVPTEKWKSYRGANHNKVLADAILDGYSELYAVYPDAHARNTAELEHVFSTKSNAGKQVITKTARTFQNLCKLADFSEIQNNQVTHQPKENVSQDQYTKHKKAVAMEYSVPSLHIDIQVHISPDASAEQIDHIFGSMAKHLYKNKNGL